jgi:membrane protease YdiL (CAAX protease family)
MTLFHQAAGMAMLGLVVFGLWGWTHVALRRLRGEPVLPYEPRRPVPWVWWDLWPLMVFVALHIAGLAMMYTLGGTADLEEAAPEGTLRSVVMQGVVSIGFAVAAIGFVVLRAGATPRDLGLSLTALPRDLRIGVAAFFTLALPVLLMQAALVQWRPSKHPLIEMLRDQPSPLLFAASFTLAVIIAPVVEEYLFRVLLQGWLEKAASPPAEEIVWASPAVEKDHDVYAAEVVAERRPPYWPIFVSAAVFALMHFSHGPDPIPLFFLALGLGYLYRQTHRAAPCIMVHVLLNGMSMTLLFLEIAQGEK